MIPLFDPKAQLNIQRREIDSAINRVLDSGMYILGREVLEFEKEFAQYIGCKYAVGVASGTEALSLALVACGVKPGDKVLLPANSYPSVFAISAIGAIPKLVDIKLDTYTIDQSKLEKAIDTRTKAIIPVHLYGQSSELDTIIAVAKKYKVPVIEDCAQAHGAEYKKKRVGAFGDLGCFSFYPTKNLGAYGDGGIVTSNKKDIIDKVRLLRMYGEKKRYNSIVIGYNSRLDELQAGILRVKLRHLDKENIKRRKNASFYTTLLKHEKNIVLPKEVPNNKHVYHLFVISCKKRNRLQQFLKSKGVLTAIHYPRPIHLQKSYSFLGNKKGDFPNTEYSAENVLSLPIFPSLTHEKIRFVCEKIREFYL